MRYQKNGNLLVDDIVKALNSLDGWGSLEIFVQNHKVTQISKRSISKTNHELKSVATNGRNNKQKNGYPPLSKT